MVHRLGPLPLPYSRSPLQSPHGQWGGIRQQHQDPSGPIAPHSYRHVLLFVDNDAARHSLVAGYSPSLDSAALITYSAHQDTHLHLLQWVARVPSFSNISDGPSRGDYSKLEKMPHSVRYSVTPPEPLVGYEALAGFPRPCDWVTEL